MAEFTRAEFLALAGQQPSLYQRTMMMERPEVTRIAIDALLSGKASVVPGFMNALLAESTRLMSRQLAAISADRLMTMGNAWLGQAIAGRVFGNVAYDDPIPGCSYTVLKGAGHGIHEERPTEYLQALQQFMAEVATRPSASHRLW